MVMNVEAYSLLQLFVVIYRMEFPPWVCFSLHLPITIKSKDSNAIWKADVFFVPVSLLKKCRELEFQIVFEEVRWNFSGVDGTKPQGMVGGKNEAAV